MDSKHVRIHLKVDGGSSFWVSIPQDVTVIRDFIEILIKRLSLEHFFFEVPTECFSLLLHGSPVPHDESIHILRDGDVIHLGTREPRNAFNALRQERATEADATGDVQQEQHGRDDRGVSPRVSGEEIQKNVPESNPREDLISQVQLARKLRAAVRAYAKPPTIPARSVPPGDDLPDIKMSDDLGKYSLIEITNFLNKGIQKTSLSKTQKKAFRKKLQSERKRLMQMAKESNLARKPDNEPAREQDVPKNDKISPGTNMRNNAEAPDRETWPQSNLAITQAIDSPSINAQPFDGMRSDGVEAFNSPKPADSERFASDLKDKSPDWSSGFPKEGKRNYYEEEANRERFEARLTNDHQPQYPSSPRAEDKSVHYKLEPEPRPTRYSPPPRRDEHLEHHSRYRE